QAGEEGADGLQFTLKSGKTQTTLQGQDFGGEFKGYIDVRDRILPEVESGLDQLKHDLITQVNAKHAGGVDLNGNTGQDFFEPVNSYQSAAVALDDNNFAGSDGKKLKLTVGSGSVQKVTVNTTDTIQDIRDKINDQVDGAIASVVADGSAYRLKVAATNSDVSVDVNTNDLNGNLASSGNTFEQVEGNTSLQVALKSPQDVAAGISDSPGDNRNALEIAELKDAQVAGANNNSTFVDAYGKISSSVGVEMKQNDFSRESLRDTLNQLENRRDEVAGVSIDESMIDLQRYQRAFQASAQYVSTVDEMMQTLLGIKR
ncbi:MAG: FlgK family flagellar hook-associated protein, partial [Thermodesulfobacteriota bacterium]